MSKNCCIFDAGDAFSVLSLYDFKKNCTAKPFDIFPLKTVFTVHEWKICTTYIYKFIMVMGERKGFSREKYAAGYMIGETFSSQIIQCSYLKKSVSQINVK